jgi:hypothetical protein
MQCRQCGTEIAGKAIVCYRCGTATTDPVRRPVRIEPRRSRVVPLAVIVVLVSLALYAGQASRTASNPEILQLAAGLLGGAAAVVLLLQIVRRR